MNMFVVNIIPDPPDQITTGNMISQNMALDTVEFYPAGKPGGPTALSRLSHDAGG